jgi:hypothetical protein
MKRTPSIIVCLAVIVTILTLWLNRREKVSLSVVVNDKATNEIVAPPAVEKKPARVEQQQSTKSTNVPPKFIAEVNRFIAAANPFGSLKEIKPEEVLGVNNDGGRFTFATKTHLAEFFTKGLKEPRLHNFIATEDASNPVLPPKEKVEAQRQWYKATSKWTEDAALAETLRIVSALQMPIAVAKHEVKAPRFRTKNPQGEMVEVTPFYSVELFNAAGHRLVSAEFRMGESGPGQLTTWWAANIGRIDVAVSNQ